VPDFKELDDKTLDDLLGAAPTTPSPTTPTSTGHEAGIMGELLGDNSPRAEARPAPREAPVEIDLGMPRYGEKPEGAWAGTSWRPAKHNPRGQMLFTTIMAAHPEKVREIYERFTPMQRRVFHLHFFGLPRIVDQPGTCGKPMTLEEIGDFFLAIEGRDKTTKQAGANIQKIMRRCRADFAQAGLPDPLPRATMPKEQSLGELAKSLTVNQVVSRDDVIRDIDQATCRLRSQLQAANAAYQKREAEQRERDRKALFGAQNPKKHKFLQKRMPKGFNRPIRHRRVGKTRHQS